MTTDKIFVVGGTGNIGTRVVANLLAKNIPTTVYARNPAKVEVKNNLLSVVQGDYDDLTPLKSSIKGHTRLFLLIVVNPSMVALKKSIAEIAYAAGVKQIVDISSLSVSAGGRVSYIGAVHEDSENAIYNLPGRSGTFVAIRPTRFMSNAIWLETGSIKTGNYITDVSDENTDQGWISNDDIADLATKIFEDPVEKHGNSVYEMVGEVLTPAKRAEIYTKVLGRPISYRRATYEALYNFSIETLGLPHQFAYGLIQDIMRNHETLAPAYTVLLGRPAHTFESFIKQNKKAFSA